MSIDVLSHDSYDVFQASMYSKTDLSILVRLEKGQNSQGSNYVAAAEVNQVWAEVSHLMVAVAGALTATGLAYR